MFVYVRVRNDKATTNPFRFLFQRKNVRFRGYLKMSTNGVLQIMSESDGRGTCVAAFAQGEWFKAVARDV